MSLDVARFWSKVDKNGPLVSSELGRCWNWTAALTGNGYGLTSIDGQLVGAHRVAFELTIGPIPDGLELDHLCRRPQCVNPEYLDPVTHAENMRRWRDTPSCAHGHPWTTESTGVDIRGHRFCRICRNTWNRVNRPRVRRQAVSP